MPPRRRSPAAPGSPTPQAAPPSIAESLLYSLQAWPIEVAVHGHVLYFPAMPASIWIAAIMEDDIVGELLDLVDKQVADDLLYECAIGELDPEKLADILLDVITECSGRPWWVTLRILHAAAGAWDTIGGAMALKGIRAFELPLQGYMDALLATILNHTEPKDQNSLLAKLKVPVGGKAPAIDEKREADAFMAYMHRS